MKTAAWVMLAGALLSGCANLLLVDPVASPADPFYPPVARDRDVSGLVYLNCTLVADRRLDACEVRYESLPGWGFGAAALQKAETLVVNSTAPANTIVGQFIVFCGSESGCVRMKELRAQIKADRDRRRAEAGQPESTDTTTNSSSSAASETP